MLASSYGDPVLGLDIHWEFVPMPAPVPTPIPNPFTGVIFDPLGLAIGLALSNAIGLVTGEPFKGPVIYWGVFPATNTGTEAKHIPGHILIPPGTGWAPIPRTPKPTIRPGETPKPPKPISPDNDAVCIFGSKTVSVMGTNAVRMGEALLSCSEPVRLPSSAVIAVAKGAPIQIGGPSSLDLMAALFASLRTRFISDSIHSLISRLSPSRFRNFLSWAACKLTGHPVDVATGRVLTWFTEFELPGPLPLKVERFYSSAFASRTGPLGNGWSHSLHQAVWRERGKVIYLAEDGRELEFDTFHLPNHQISAGEQVWYPYDRLTLRCLEHDKWEIERADGLVSAFALVPGLSHNRAMIQSIRSRDGYSSIAFHYDLKGRLAWVQDSAQRIIRFEHDDQDRLTTVVLPDPQGLNTFINSRYRYDAAGDLVEVTDALGASWKFEYVTHLLTKETDRRQLSFFFAYDGFGEDAWCIRTWGDGGIYDHVLNYDKKNHITYVTNSLGRRTQYHANPLGLITKVVDPMGGETTYEYDDPTLQCTKETDPLGHAFLSSFDHRGRLIASTQPDGAAIRIDYDERGLPIRATDVLGGQWSWEHDSHGQLLTEINPLGDATGFRYVEGRLINIINQNGGIVTFSYDDFRNVTTCRNPDGGLIERRYDYLGRPAISKDPSGNIEEYRFDLLGRVVEIYHSDGNRRTATYSPEGDILSIKDNDRELRFSYTGRRRLAKKFDGQGSTEFAYDTEEQLVEIKNEKGLVYRFDLDASGNTLAETGFDGRRHTYRRDALGRAVQWIKPSGNATRYTYDWADRVIGIEYADKSTAAYAYRSDGHLIEAINASATVRFERDALGRVGLERQNDHWIRSEYDALNMRVVMESSLGAYTAISRNIMGDAIGMRHRNLDEFAKPSLWEARFERDFMGLELARETTGGIRSQWDRDTAGHPLRHTLTARAGIIRDDRYTWRTNHRLSQIEHSPVTTTRYVHNAAGSLVAAESADLSIDFRMPDEVGNLFRTAERLDRIYGPAGQILQAVERSGIATFQYDADGNRLSKTLESGDTWKYEWSAAGWLKSVRRSTGDVVEFAYDALGRRLSKSSSAGSVSWVWDGHRLLHELRGAPAGSAVASSASASNDPHSPAYGTAGVARITWLFEPESFAPVAQVIGDKAYGIITDHLGTPAVMLDENGREVWAFSSDVFGKSKRVTPRNKIDVPFRYPGFSEDKETGLCYNRFRYYDPEAGSYISQDPILTYGGFRLYSYVPDPLTFLDLFGLVGGGSYRQVRGSNIGGEVHHMPANSVSPLSHGSGPGIWMTRADHLQTGSWGSSYASRAYRAQQAQLLAQGDWKNAILMDIRNVQKISNAYDQSIRQMLDHCEKNGILSTKDVKDIKQKCGL